MGYVATAGKLYPFQEKIAVDSKQTDEPTTLWNHIKLGSQHLDEWNDLFSNDGTHHTTFQIIRFFFFINYAKLSNISYCSVEKKKEYIKMDTNFAK